MLLALLHRQEGQSMAEYGLILALIAAVCIVSLGLLGTGINDMLTTLTAQL